MNEMVYRSLILKKTICLSIFLFLSLANLIFAQSPQSAKYSELPGKYFRLLEAGVLRIQNKLIVEPEAGLKTLEKQAGWSHFPSSILIPAVLYAKSNPENVLYGKPEMLKLAERIGDMLVSEHQKGLFTPRGDSDWDTYMWLEAYRLLEPSLSEKRRILWRQAILDNLSELEPRLLKYIDSPLYNAPFIVTSPNHYSIYASTLLVAGKVFNKPEWVQIATTVLHRFVTREQTPDGFWGENSQTGPTTGYDYLTETQIALYWEYTSDPDALNALRRSTTFHASFTWPDGTPVETINDRNRYWDVSMWGHFGFSNFPDGRRYSEFLTSFFPEDGDIQSLSRIAQNVIYYHEGETDSIPQDQNTYSHLMNVPAGIRKSGPWVVCLSGLIEPEDILNNFFLDRQGNLSIFYTGKGLIITGANSKRQPELATFTETLNNTVVHMPLSSHLIMNDKADRLALSYNTFFSLIDIQSTTNEKIGFCIHTYYKWGDASSKLNLQLVLKAGLTLKTGSGLEIKPGKEIIDLGPEILGGSIAHNGWVLHLPPDAHLSWPVYPFNPYADGPETTLDHAIGVLSVPLKEEDQEFCFSLEVK
jgi:hypothetical protein